MDLVQLAEAQSHKVLFLPPHSSDLQPLELVWALVKENIGRMSARTTTLEEVRKRLFKEFKMLSEDVGQYQSDKKTLVQTMIETTDKVVQQHHENALGEQALADRRGQACDEEKSELEDDERYQEEDEEEDFDVTNDLLL
eukprot:m.42738 g.42738  ORF g.42738 m.42738 type:complete len:140 (+) comp11969_c0_seq1:181-600(+)